MQSMLRINSFPIKVTDFISHKMITLTNGMSPPVRSHLVLMVLSKQLVPESRITYQPDSSLPVSAYPAPLHNSMFINYLLNIHYVPKSMLSGKSSTTSNHCTTQILGGHQHARGFVKKGKVH